MENLLPIHFSEMYCRVHLMLCSRRRQEYNNVDSFASVVKWLLLGIKPLKPEVIMTSISEIITPVAENVLIFHSPLNILSLTVKP